MKDGAGGRGVGKKSTSQVSGGGARQNSPKVNEYGKE